MSHLSPVKPPRGVKYGKESVRIKQTDNCENNNYEQFILHAVKLVLWEYSLFSINEFYRRPFILRGFYGLQSGSGLLVTVIKTLDSSDSLEERQREKLKIEKEFKKMDVKLNELVAKHDGDLAKVMQLFGQVSSKISTSRSQIHQVKSSLLECKKLLRCKRDELQKLWSDAVQQKYVLEMLEQM